MAKRYNIRWSASDREQLARNVKNYNAKVRRLEKKYANDPTVIIPERMSAREIAKSVTTRKDLQKETKALQSFTKRGAEKLVDVPESDKFKITEWQHEQMSRNAQTVNKRRSERLDKLMDQEMYRNGKPLGYTRGEIGMGQADVLMYQPTKPFTKGASKADIAKKFKHLQNESRSDYWHQRDITLRDNFIQAISQNFSINDIREVIDTIMNMDIDAFIEHFNQFPETFETAYPPSKEDYDGYVQELKSNWLPVGKGE